MDACVTTSHIVLTRFNVRLCFSPVSDSDPQWLEHRFGLFDRFCYPCMRAQSNQNFKWLVLFDKNTSAQFRRRIDQYAKWDRFIPIFVESFADTNLDYVVRAHISAKSKYLITSRIDNDDAFCTTFINDVQSVIDQRTPTVINFTEGLLLDLVQGKLYRRFHRSNPFISLVEEVGPDRLSTVWGAEHNRASRLGTVRQIGGQAAWLQIVHDKNALNEVVEGWQVPLGILESRFAINHEGLPKSGFMEILRHNLKYGARGVIRRTWRAIS